MCVDIHNERGAKNYINELLSTAWGRFRAPSALRSFQVHHEWLLDYTIKYDKLVLKFVPTGQPAMELIEKVVETALTRYEHILDYA